MQSGGISAATHLFAFPQRRSTFMDVGTALVVVALIASAAYVCAPLARLYVARRFCVPLPAGVVTPTADAVQPPPVDLPDVIQAICDKESETWARGDMRNTARALYAENGDWNAVAVLLERM